MAEEKNSWEEILNSVTSTVKGAYETSRQAIQEKLKESGISDRFDEALESLSGVNKEMQQSLTAFKDASAEKVSTAYQEALDAIQKAKTATTEKLSEIRDKGPDTVKNMLDEAGNYYDRLSSEVKEKYNELTGHTENTGTQQDKSPEDRHLS